jgi:hypothetical protein
MLTVEQAAKLAYRSVHRYQDQYVGGPTASDLATIQELLEEAAISFYYNNKQTFLVEKKKRTFGDFISDAERKGGESEQDTFQSMEESVNMFMANFEAMMKQDLIVEEIPNVAKQKTEIFLLRQTLEFYANPKNWKEPSDELAMPPAKAYQYKKAQSTLSRVDAERGRGHV